MRAVRRRSGGFSGSVRLAVTCGLGLAIASRALACSADLVVVDLSVPTRHYKKQHWR